MEKQVSIISKQQQEIEKLKEENNKLRFILIARLYRQRKRLYRAFHSK